MTDEEWQNLQNGLHAKATGSPMTKPGAQPASSDSGGVLSSLGAGVKGAYREAIGDKSEDPEHSTAEWVGRQATDWGPMIATDALMPEVGLPAAAARYAPRAASLIGKGLTGAYKGAIGGAWAQPKGGATTGAEAGTASGLARGAFGMLPPWAKAASVGGGLANAAGLWNIARETGGQHGHGGYVSPWSVHHAISALAGLAALAAGMPATTGGAVTKIVGDDQ